MSFEQGDLHRSLIVCALHNGLDLQRDKPGCRLAPTKKPTFGGLFVLPERLVGAIVMTQ